MYTGHPKIVYMDRSTLENRLGYAIKCKYSVWKDLKKLKTLSEAGHEIAWSGNERWCVVDGKTFNISKSVYVKRVIESDLEEVFSDFTWDDDGGHKIQILYDNEGKDYEVLFDINIHDPNAFDFSKILGHLK